MDIKFNIKNIIWHIETNRETQNNDSKMLDDVYKALKNIEKKI